MRRLSKGIAQTQSLHLLSFCRTRNLENFLVSRLGSTAFHSSAAVHSDDHSNDAKSCCYEYDWIDGAEKLEMYEPGGYHPVMIGDVLRDRYAIVDKLGFGGYSTVWLARDIHQKQYVALKVGIATDSIGRDAKILRAFAASESSTHPGRDSVPCLLDEFNLTGPNGTHPCYTVAPAQCNLRRAVFTGMFPIRVARVLSAGLVQAVSYNHSRGYVHGDIHLSNVLVKLPSSFDHLSIAQFYHEYGEPDVVPVTHRDGMPLPPNVPKKAVIPLDFGKPAKQFSLSDSRVLLSDFGEAFSPDSEVRRGEDCHTPLAMRPPESRFDPQRPLSYSADIWSLAVTIWEIIGMKSIFSNDWITADEITAQQIDTLGPMPLDWWERWDERSQFFDTTTTTTTTTTTSTGERPKHLEGRQVWPRIEDVFGDYVQNYRNKYKVGEFDSEETAAILDLMRKMLVFRPKERLSVDEVLQSEWMVKWALPEWTQLHMGESIVHSTT